MQGLSVRDEGSAAVIEQLCDIKPRIVCDPALLYDFDRARGNSLPANEKAITLWYMRIRRT